MVFRKERMIARLEREGRADLIDSEIVQIMDDLDGQEANTSCWNRRVYDEPVLLVIGKSGKSHYVNENDCI